MSEVDQGQKTDGGGGRVPPSWVESRRFVPRAFVQPVLSFMRTEASGGIIMLIAAVVAVAWANSPWGETYFSILETHIEIAFGEFHFHHLSELTVQQWVNDALMTIFFFVVGLEIKRELVEGELRDPKAAALPAIAALGGMFVPAGIYLAFTASLGSPASDGWGIPVATDIAFAVGVVSMVGRKVPIAAKLFLLALAIVDDIGGILIIAIFYTEKLALSWLIAALVGLVVVVVMKQINVRSVAAYLAVGSFVWLAVLESGVHATLAGVALGLLAPTRPFYRPEFFPARARQLVDKIDGYVGEGGDLDHHTTERVESLMEDLRRLSRESIAPIIRLEHGLAKISSFLVVPIFALANAGVVLSGDSISSEEGRAVFLGITLGLLVGKTFGVFGATWLALKLGLGTMPRGANLRHLFGMSMLSGIGFTVALFIGALSFETGSPLLAAAKVGIFVASILAGVGGFVFLKMGKDESSGGDEDPHGEPADAPVPAHV